MEKGRASYPNILDLVILIIHPLRANASLGTFDSRVGAPWWFLAAWMVAGCA